MYIGSVIKKLRVQRGLRQRDIVGDFLSLKQLSRIEKNTSIPSYDTLNWLSFVLGKELFSYFPYSDDPSVYEIKHELDELKRLYSREHYVTLLAMIEQSSYVEKTKNKLAYLEYIWLRNTSLFNIKQFDAIDKQLLYHCLAPNLNKSNLLSIFERPLLPIEFKIIIIIIVLLDENEDDLLEKQAYERAIKNFESYNVSITEPVYLIYCYNYARLLYMAGDYRAAVSVGSKGIENCQTNFKYTFIGYLYNIVGKSNFRLGNHKLGRSQMRAFIGYARIFEFEKFPDYAVNGLIKNYDLWPIRDLDDFVESIDRCQIDDFRLLI